jgi:hypothetical protein
MGARSTFTTRSIARQVLQLLLLLSVGCSGASGTYSSTVDCSDVVDVSETSNGTFTFAANGVGLPAEPAMAGSLGPSNELTLSAGVGCGTGSPQTGPAFTVAGQYTDATGNVQPFCALVGGVAQGTETTLSPDSIMCLTAANRCAPLMGSVNLTTYESTCASSGACTRKVEDTVEWTCDSCTLDVAGTLSATAIWPEGTFTVNLTLGHRDEAVTGVCH